MPINVRLNEREQEEIRKKCIEINKILIEENREPIKDSELVHKILDKVTNIRVTKSGEIYFEE